MLFVILLTWLINAAIRGFFAMIALGILHSYFPGVPALAYPASVAVGLAISMLFGMLSPSGVSITK